jgi:hypothetical protein
MVHFGGSGRRSDDEPTYLGRGVRRDGGRQVKKEESPGERESSRENHRERNRDREKHGEKQEERKTWKREIRCI